MMASEKKQLQDTGDLPPAEDRIYVDNSNISELKSTCDDAVERVRLTSAHSGSLFRRLTKLNLHRF